jgi:hypothetical protein
MRPSPEQWWSGMSRADQAEFMNEVTTGGPISLDMWMKLRGGGVVSPGSGYVEHEWEYYLPASHLGYVLARAAERGA